MIRVFFSKLEFIANWQIAQVIFKNEKIPPNQCWDLNLQPLGYETSALTIILRFVLNKACQRICQVTICTEFSKFGKSRILNVLLPYHLTSLSFKIYQYTSHLRKAHGILSDKSRFMRISGQV